MHDEVLTPVIFSFLLVLARVSSIFVFLPIPMMRQAPEVPKIVLALTLSCALFPFWPKILEANPAIGTVIFWIFREASIGLAIGLTVSFVSEGLAIATQMISAQAGYSYATSVDPSSNADSGVLPVLGQLMASMLFFALGFDRQIIGALATSLTILPPGSMAWKIDAFSAEAILKLSSGMFSTALRLALPVAGLLIILDLSLALLSRVNQQLQLLTVAFPAKMLLALAMLAVLTPVIALVYESQGMQAFATLQQLMR